MAHRLEKEPFSGGEALDVIFRIEQNTHEDFGGGLQLVLSDFRRSAEVQVAASAAAKPRLVTRSCVSRIFLF